MNYNRIAATANAARYINQRDAETRLEVERRISPAGNKMMACGLTCQEWIDIYLKRKLPAKVVEHNTETTNDDEDRREATGTEARPIGAGEGVGDPPGEEGQGEAVAGSSPEGARPAESAGSSISGISADQQETSQGGDAPRLDDPGNEASWIDEAYPEGSEGADFTEADRTPF